MLYIQGTERIYFCDGLYLIFRRVEQSHSGVTEQDVRHLVLIVAGHVLGNRTSLTYGHIVRIDIFVPEEGIAEIAVDIGVLRCIHRSAGG